MGKALVWFRNDLRLADNEPLSRACENNEEVWLLYVFDPRHWAVDPFGHRKTGSHRTRFLVESLLDLQARLAEKKAKLILREGLPHDVIQTLHDELHLDAVYASSEPAYEEQRAASEVEQALSGVSFHWFSTASLLHPNDLPFEINALPEVFTTFRKRCEKNLMVREPLPEPRSIPLGQVDVEPGDIPESYALPTDEGQDTSLFRGGETASYQRLRHYFWDTRKLSSYKFTRNGLLGADYSSKFSPWLANGSLSPRTIYAELKRYEREVTQNVSTYWLFFELMWRDFFRFHGEKHGNRIFHPGGIGQAQARLGIEAGAFEAWKAGETGIPFIDANMRELNETGFMSNRGRQNVASFLVKDLGIDWRYGASWFESQLIDYDVYSNWCNWNYVAGVGADPRSDRYFNVITQATRYDAKGEYVKHWLPELQALGADEVHQPYRLSRDRQAFYGLSGRFLDPVVVSPRWK